MNGCCCNWLIRATENEAEVRPLLRKYWTIYFLLFHRHSIIRFMGVLEQAALHFEQKAETDKGARGWHGRCPGIEGGDFWQNKPISAARSRTPLNEAVAEHQ
jgi:hypothetical protein